jgi:SAM-dependent methyltransferase
MRDGRRRDIAVGVLRVARQAGFDPLLLRATLTGAPRLARELREYRRLERRAGGRAPRLADLDLILHDAGAEAGTASGQYFHQDLWAARLIHARAPGSHVDVGSRLDGFVSSLLAFREVTVIDIRPLTSQVQGLTFVQGDATELAQIEDATLESVSSLHAVEHFGLGRYGDELDPTGSRRAMATLARVTAPGGRLYLSVPIGVERVMFNAQRVLHPERVLEAVQPLELVSFAAVDDAGAFVPAATPADFASARNACGLFELTRPGAG